MGNKKVKSRKEIDNKYKWKISKIYDSPQAWLDDYKKAGKLAEDFSKHSGVFTKNAENFKAAIKDSEELEKYIDRLFVFSKMKLDEDNTVSESQERFGLIMGLVAKAGAATSFFTPELLQADEETILSYLKDPELSIYSFSIKNTLKEKEHILSKEEESILSALAEVRGCPDNIFSMLNDADMKFGEIEDENGEKVELTHGNYIRFLENHNRDVRKAAFENMYTVYKDHINTLSALYSASVKNDVITAKLRKYKSSRNMALSPSEISEDVYDNLISTVHQNLPVLYRYVDLRKELLELDQLKMWDVYVPLVEVPDEKITFNEAREMMSAALAPLGEDYVNTLQNGIDSGWADIYENKGKTSGAYSFGCYESDPYMLLNYNESLQDVLTLIHESGHSMHSWYTRKNQPYVYGSYSTFVAEVASTVNECLLLHYLLENETDLQRKKFILNRFIEEFRATVFRQTMFAEFELGSHEFVEKDGSLTPEKLTEEYDRLNTLYFGEALSHDDLIKYEWSRIPHFYSAYYVYQYATGFSAATAISKRILTEGKPAVEDYKKFLSSGSSDYPVNELKIAGVDMSKKESIETAMEMFEELVNEFEKLCR